MSTHSGATGPVDGIHVPYQWTYATATARAAATGFASTDIGKLAIQSDTNQLWQLTATTPVWQPIGVPIFTTTQRNALTATTGLVIYNSSTNKLNVWTGAAWEVISST